MIRAILLGVLASLATVGHAVAQNTNCGTERWTIKTLSDPDTTQVLFTPIQSSVHEQNALPAVSPGTNDARTTNEMQAVSVRARIVKFKLEDDGDLHLVLNDPNTGESMIAEIPNPDCPTVQTTGHVAQYRVARQWVMDNLGNPTTSFKSVDVEAKITGIGYYDPPHGQTGKAANNRELHPVLAITSTSGVEARASTSTFSISPNPAQTLVHVLGAKGEIRIVTVDGKVVLSSRSPDLHIEGLDDGIYIVQSGKESCRLVIKR